MGPYHTVSLNCNYYLPETLPKPGSAINTSQTSMTMYKQTIYNISAYTYIHTYVYIHTYITVNLSLTLIKVSV